MVLTHPRIEARSAEAPPKLGVKEEHAEVWSENLGFFNIIFAQRAPHMVYLRIPQTWNSETPEGFQMLLGYARVSTDDQRLDLQIDAMIEAGVDPDWIYQEHVSGAKTDRPQLEACLKAIREG